MPLRIATWNLARCPPGGARGQSLAAMMAAVDADVWILTEGRRDFPPAPGHRLVACSAAAPDRDDAGEERWVAIWSRLVAEPVAVSADPQRHAAARLTEGDIVVVGTVLPWTSDGRDAPLRGTAAFLARLAEQAASWADLRRSWGRICVAGDFNQDLLASGHYCGSRAGRAALRDALADAGLRCLTGDGDDPLAVLPGLASIDHLCVAGLEPTRRPVSRAWPPPGELSRRLTDHYGVWSDLRPVQVG